jgi:hypothetical protein
MPYLEAVDVDDRLVDELWEKLSCAGSYYSIADGISKDNFRSVLFRSSLVLRGPQLLVHLSEEKDFVELHPIAFGPECFRYASEALEDVGKFCERLFAKKPLCCIIPDGMRGARALARAAGMSEAGGYKRMLSGIEVSCTIFKWR